MPQISVTTTITTAFDVPEGLTIEQVRHAGLPDLSEMEEIIDDVVARHDQVMNQIYIGCSESRSCSIEHAIAEVVTDALNPA